MKFKIKLVGLFGASALVLGVAVPAGAITWGRPDRQRIPERCNRARHRRVAELGSRQLQRKSARPRRDEDRDPTAAHCTDTWIAEIAAGTLDSVGVWFDENNQVNGTTSDASFYVRGGVPISFPAKDAPFETFDYGLVVFAADAANSLGETVTQRWGALTPVQVAPNPGYVSAIIGSVRNPSRNLLLTVVGYGTGEKFPIPGQETGPADPSGSNESKFLIRYIADNLTYNSLNPSNDVLRLSMNIAKGESGTCNGDSGGPIFYHDATLGTVQISLVSGGDAV